MNIVSLMTSYYHVITIEYMIISNLWSQENLTYLPEILLRSLILTLVKKKKKNRQTIRSHHEINKAKARVGGMIEGVMRAMGEWQMKFSSQDCCWPPDVWFICTPGVGDPCSTWLHLHIHMTNLDIIVKSRDITLLTKVHIVKAMFFPAVMYDVRVGP